MEKSKYKSQKHTIIKDGSTCKRCYQSHGPILELIDDGDWREAFVYANDFTREDVKRVIHMSNGENDGPAWIGLFELKNGKFAGLNAGCDYTGWD
jgi:hypothetical protein